MPSFQQGFSARGAYLPIASMLSTCTHAVED
jgi:hypothetical protein